MPQFRKKPVVIEARRLPLANDPVDLWAEVNALVDWCGGRATGDGVVIPTLEGDHLASPGDWIIRGVKGEFYPCKPEIFAMTYESA